jgi:hypothetical protein
VKKRTLIMGACVLSAFILISFLEFDYWFYNNEMPAYLRGGVLAGDASDALRTFYEAARNACPEFHPKSIEHCETYQLALLGEARYVRPTSSAAGLLLTAMAQTISFMQALKFAIILLAVGGAILCGLMLLPFLAVLDGRALAAIGLVWVAGWVGTRPLHTEGPAANIILIVFASIVIALGIWCVRAPNSLSDASRYRFDRGQLAKFKPALKCGLGLLGIVLCFWLGYRLHLLFESRHPIVYLVLAIGLWPLLNRVSPAPGNWAVSGLLAAVLYLMGSLVPFMFRLSLVKHHEQLLVGIMIFMAIWRGNTRVFWTLPVLLLLDMQSAMRLCALIIIAEGIVGLLRREMPIAIAPALLTAVVGFVVMKATVVYPFDARLYNVFDAIALLKRPEVLAGGFVSLVLIFVAASRISRQSTTSIAIDRFFVYAAGVVALGGIQISTWGLLFDAFQLSDVFTSVGPAPAIAIFSVVIGLCLKGLQEGESELQRRSSIAALAAILLLMSTTKGGNASLSQFGKGVRATVSGYLPANWIGRRTPYMTLQDNIVYFSAENLMTSALMQYSVMKIFLLSRSSKLADKGITVLPFRP